MNRALSVLTLAAILGPLASPMLADEGMWLFNQPPIKQLKEKYGFEPTAAWLEHLQKSAVRFNSGGSGSFVSANGLVMTNHHVGADAIYKLSSAGHDLLEAGFLAKTEADELQCVDLELNVLMSIQNVTDRVNAAVKPDQSAAEAQLARRAVINTIEKEGLDKTGLRSDVVTLYQGGEYHLYQFKKYTDVRLVFAPEKAIAFFGGDPDNFEYPRYDLDIAFFRVYENDKPAKIDHYLKWSTKGAADSELIFVAGHPGRTNRLNTVGHLEYFRDLVMPTTLDLLRRREVLLKTYSDRSLENARRAEDELFGIQNSRKARLGGLGGLQDPAIMSKKQKEEAELKATIAGDSELKKLYGTAWDDVDNALATAKTIRVEHNMLEAGHAFNSDLFGIARTLVRLAAEDAKPNADRLREFGEAGRSSLEQQLYSEAPIYPDLEIVKLGDSLSYLAEQLGMNYELVKKILAGKSPRERARELINSTALATVADRKKVAAGKAAAIERSQDPLIQLAKLVDLRARELRTTLEQQVEEPQRQAYAKIAAARFKLLGTSTYPDATFTLRLAYGAVKGLEEGGQQIPPWTTLGGTFEHAQAHGGDYPFALPKSWHDAKSHLKMETPYNFVSTADIIGGNSGSPVVNRQGEVVGIIFDGNNQSLVLDFSYNFDKARAVSVHSSGITEALRSIYRADRLLKELNP